MPVTSRVSIDECNLSSSTPVPMSIPSGSLVDLGAKADAVVADPTASASLIAATKGLQALLGVLTSSAVVDPTASGNINALLKGLLTDLGPVTASAVSDPTASAGVIAALKGVLTQIGILTSTSVIDPTASGNLNALTKGLLKQLQGTGTGYAPVSLATSLSSEYDSIDMAKMSKGGIQTAGLVAVIVTTTSTEIDCRRFNAISVEMACSAFSSGNWVASILGCAISGGTFGQCYWPKDDGTFVAQATPTISTNGNTTYIFRGIPNYVKIAAVRTTDGTLTCTVTPMNL